MFLFIPGLWLVWFTLLVFAFSAQARYQYSIENSSVTILRYTCEENDREVIIPGIIEGLPVTAIGDYAFALSEIRLPDSILVIEQQTFFSCTSLGDVRLPSGLTRIGDQAFANCSSLVHVTIPKSVLSLDNNAFLGCGNLTELHVEVGNPVYRSVDGILFTSGLFPLSLQDSMNCL